ncbi:PAS domain-containing protein [Streptomyces sp. NBC_01260]|nr:PAS domain-containing protein [Streptomyces sp. NBC_01260]
MEASAPSCGTLLPSALRERTSFSLYFRVLLREGSPRWTHTQGNVVSDDDRPVRVIGIISDASQELLAVEQTEEVRRARMDRRRQTATSAMSLQRQVALHTGRTDRPDRREQRHRAVAPACTALRQGTRNRQWAAGGHASPVHAEHFRAGTDDPLPSRTPSGRRRRRLVRRHRDDPPL